MALAQTFDNRLSAVAERRAALSDAVRGLRSRDEQAPISAPVEDEHETAGPSDAIPLFEALALLLPLGLQRGEAIEIDTRSGIDYLTVTILAGALRAGLWCGAIGMPDLGGLVYTRWLAADVPAQACSR